MMHRGYYDNEMNRFERALLQSALESHGWNRVETAKFLGISYRGLIYKMLDHKLMSPGERSRIERTAERFHAASAQ